MNQEEPAKKKETKTKEGDSSDDYETENVDLNAVMKEMEIKKKKFKRENDQESD